MARKLSEEFINELKEGKFRPVLQAVLDDDSLDLELRGDCVIIYYRGGKLLTLNSNGTFEALDSNYHESTTFLNIVPCLDKLEDYILRAKKIIDNYITHAKKKNHLGEKEIQQMIIRENNYSPTDIDASTDFFIIDTEYKDSSSNGQFDIIALQWNSTSSDHKQKNVELAFIEVKQGFKSVSTKSGLLKHISDYKKFTNSSTFEEFKKDMLDVFEQKVLLGLIPKAIKWMPNKDKGKKFRLSDKTKFYVILANYDPDSSKLSSELDAMEKEGITDCLFFTSSFCGYGLYKEGIKTQDEIKDIINRSK